MNVDQAVTFVESSGTPAQIALARYAVGRIDADQALRAIIPHQRADGSWSGIDLDMPDAVSSISQTWIGLQWLIWLSPAGQNSLDRTAAFLKRVQHPEGCWDEPDEIAAHNPPSWMMPGNHDNQVWLTSAVSCKLKELGRTEDVNYEQALDFLRGSWQREEKQFNEGVHAHWMALPVFNGSVDAFDCEIAVGCRDRLADALDRDAVDPGDLAAIAYAGLLTSDVDLFRRSLNKIERTQRLDGGMTTRYGDQHRPNGTVEVLFLLKRANMLPPVSTSEA